MTSSLRNAVWLFGAILFVFAMVAAVITPLRFLWVPALCTALFALLLPTLVSELSGSHPYSGVLLTGGIVVFLAAVTGAFVLGLTQSIIPSARATCSALAGPTPLPLLGGPQGGPTATPQVLHVLQVGARWPNRLNIDDSDYVGALVLHRSQVVPLGRTPTTIPTITLENKSCATQLGNRRELVATPIAVGTPGVPIERAFGKGYTAQAGAQLVAPHFSVAPAGTSWQPLGKSPVAWGWGVVPQQEGRQVLLLNIDVQWEPKSSNRGAVIQRRIWQSGPLYASVSQPTWVVGQFDLAVSVSAIAAAGGIALVTGLVTRLLSRGDK
jgi:hypothetical protein